MSRTDYILIFTSLGGITAFISAVVAVALRAKTYFDKQFSDHRRLMYDQLKERDRAIMRIEYWAILAGVKVDQPYSPAADPPYMTTSAGRNGG